MNIYELLGQIMSARYGKDVRQSIHDAIEQCYEDGKAGAIDLVARERIDALESSALVRKIVDSLPTSNISTTTVYMIPSQQSSQDNIYDEYMYINESWEKIGSSAVDLTDYLKKDGDSSNNTVTFTSGDSKDVKEWTDVELLTTGESHSSLLNKLSIIAKNVRYAINLFGTTDISAIGNGTVTGAISTLNDSLSNFLGYKFIECTGTTPAKKGSYIQVDLSTIIGFYPTECYVIGAKAYSENTKSWWQVNAEGSDSLIIASTKFLRYTSSQGNILSSPYKCVIMYK